MEREVLEFLLGHGFSADEVVEAKRAGRLTSLFTDRIVGRPRLSLVEVATRSGQPAELVSRVWRAAGFPDPEPGATTFTEEDAEALAVFGFATAILGVEEVIQLVRVMGTSLAHVAEAQVTVGYAFDRANVPTDDPLEALRASASLDELLPVVERATIHLLRRHLMAANRRLLGAPASADAEGDVRELAVGFADLAESTSLSVRLGPREFAATLGEFEALTIDAVSAQGGRVVKLIGDEVTFVSVSADGACRMALELLDAWPEHASLPPLRAAVAAGPVMTRDGDYFGPTVNLAARLVDVARPGTLVAPRTWRIA